MICDAAVAPSSALGPAAGIVVPGLSRWHDNSDRAALVFEGEHAPSDVFDSDVFHGFNVGIRHGLARFVAPNSADGGLPMPR